MARFKKEFDDPSAEFLARVRAAGVLSDTDWKHILGEIPKALRFLAKPNPTATRDERGHTVINLDADPRNATGYDWPVRLERHSIIYRCGQPCGCGDRP